ncbi:unnamed protein product [Clonostachys solani]|uniref:Rhodopsin domain-containing protein n=1 Tax=Clonostachys solani TaxID=160281 RepID=A0A9N9ZBA0_9HYPO|nr:unnamed protein product [Clonostachys solani]
MYDIYADKRPTIIGIGFGTWAVAILALLMRMGSRKARGVKLGLDDWLILAAVPGSISLVGAMAGFAVNKGFGRHIWLGKPDTIRSCAIALFIGELSYVWTLFPVKMSILAFYWRSFRVERSIRIPIYILATVITLWAMGVFLTTLLKCRPLHWNWDQYQYWSQYNSWNMTTKNQYKCDVNQIKFYYGNAIPTIVTDLAMVLLPIPYVWRLKMPKPQKIALAGILMIGLFVTIVSVVRLWSLVRVNLEDPDVTWNAVDAALWTIVEVNISILCACLPFVKPILTKISKALKLPKFSLLTSLGSITRSKKHYQSNEDSHDGNYNLSMQTDERPITYMAHDHIAEYKPEPAFNGWNDGNGGVPIELQPTYDKSAPFVHSYQR